MLEGTGSTEGKWISRQAQPSFQKISDGDGDSVDLNQKKMKKNTSPLVLDTRTADIATGSESCAVLWDFRLADFRTKACGESYTTLAQAA